MEINIASAIKEISNTIGIASSEIIPHYAQWYIASSISYMIFSCCICIGGFWWFKAAKKEIEEMTAISIFIILLFIGIFTVALQVGDLLGSQGIAIHQLIEDIRG